MKELIVETYHFAEIKSGHVRGLQENMRRSWYPSQFGVREGREGFDRRTGLEEAGRVWDGS